ncbi:hypothetical protein AB4Y38_36785 [Paraburkholderia sp. EG285A]|uniref:hypothetical protein n=1 Tax=Paraburkholderia sp. EG285A TaxID=3237009 RepID=UPI0034D2520F
MPNFIGGYCGAVLELAGSDSLGIELAAIAIGALVLCLLGVSIALLSRTAQRVDEETGCEPSDAKIPE